MSENKDDINQLKEENAALNQKIIELSKTVEALKKYEHINSTIINISRAAHKAKNVKELSGIIHENLKKIILADNFYVALYNETTNTYTFPYFVDKFDQKDNMPVDLSNSLTDYVRRTGKPLFADENIHRDLHSDKKADYIGAYSSQWLGVPLKVDDKFIGVVTVQDYSQNTVYTKDDLSILDFVANNISFLIFKKLSDQRLKDAYKELEEKVIQRTIELETLNKRLSIDVKRREEAEKIQNALYRISRSASTNEELSDLYIALHNIIKSLMPANNFFIAQVDDKKELISFPYYIDEFDNPPFPIPMELNTLTSHIIKTGNSVILNSENYLTFLDEHNIVSRGAVPKIWVGVPLIVKNNCIGAMVVQDYHSTDTYYEKDKEILTFVSHQVAKTLELKKDELQLNFFMNELYQQKWELQDTTKKLEKSNNELVQSERELTKLLHDKDKFFSIIAHDLKNPLQALLGNVEFLKSEFDKIANNEIELFVNNIHRSTKTLYSLIENLLDWSRIKIGKFEINEEIIVFPKILENVISQLEASIKTKNLNVIIEAENPLQIISDKNILEIIIRNLLSNSIKFSYENSKIIIKCSSDGKYIKIKIVDNGVGISSEHISKIFSDVETITTPGTKNEKGTGLGLGLCKELIDKIDGTISVTSKLNEGATFAIQLPIKSLDA